MTPKEKAEELVDKFFEYNYMTKWDSIIHKWIEDNNSAKQCALIAVEELIEEAYFTNGYYNRHNYWQEVKHEIEKL
jgi:hypothetical protein